MGTSTIRVGVVGAGANTVSRHLPGLLEQPDVELASVCNRSRESSERVAQQFGIGAVYESWPELVAADDSDAIVIGTWPYLHCPITLAALAAGKHVLCEARMAMNAGEARAMLAASRGRPELVAQIVPAPHTLGEDGTIRRYLAEGRLGDLLAVELDRQQHVPHRGAAALASPTRAERAQHHDPRHLVRGADALGRAGHARSSVRPHLRFDATRMPTGCAGRSPFRTTSTCSVSWPAVPSCACRCRR